MPTIDRDRIRHFLTDIQRERIFLEDVVKDGIDSFVKEVKTNKAAKYSLIVLVEAMMNILQHILAKQKDVAVRGYGDTFAKAGRFGIITPELASKLQSLAGLRNEFLTHGYWRCDDELLYRLIIDNLSDFSQFVIQIKQYLEANR